MNVCNRWSQLGASSGEIFSLFSSILGDYFGTRHGTSTYGVLYSAKGVASIAGGGLAALLYERFGGWSSAFYGNAVLALVAAAMAFGLRAAGATVRGVSLASAEPAE